MIRFSIITVCFNAAGDIERTIQSVLGQTYENIEYIIVDGGSTDGTLDIIKDYAEKDSRIKYLSESDDGLYDAMNKGVRLATGDMVQFLNAGDSFYDVNVLRKIDEHYHRVIGEKKSSNGKTEKLIIYGNIIYINQDGTENLRLYGKNCGKRIYFGTGDCVNHQACFATRNCFEDENPFNNETYRICADRDWMMRMTADRAVWSSYDGTVVKYQLTDDSVSVRDKALMKQEERICIKKNFTWLYPMYLFFDFCRNNKVLAGILHKIYEMLYIRTS